MTDKNVAPEKEPKDNAPEPEIEEEFAPQPIPRAKVTHVTESFDKSGKKVAKKK